MNNEQGMMKEKKLLNQSTNQPLVHSTIQPLVHSTKTVLSWEKKRKHNFEFRIKKI